MRNEGNRLREIRFICKKVHRFFAPGQRINSYFFSLFRLTVDVLLKDKTCRATWSHEVM
jgi:hypothetical protein